MSETVKQKRNKHETPIKLDTIRIYKYLFHCFIHTLCARKGVKVELFEMIRTKVMIFNETDETMKQSPKSLEKSRNRIELSDETNETKRRGIIEFALPDATGRGKCVYCERLEGTSCKAFGHKPEAISLLQECASFQFDREKWNREQHMLSAENGIVREIEAEGRARGIRHYLSRLSEGFTADTGLDVHQWCVGAGFLDERGRFTENGLTFLMEVGEERR